MQIPITEPMILTLNLDPTVSNYLVSRAAARNKTVSDILVELISVGKQILDEKEQGNIIIVEDTHGRKITYYQLNF